MSAPPSTGRCPLQGVTEDGPGVWVQIDPGSGSPGSKVSTLSAPGHASARKNLRKGLGSGAWGRRGTGTVRGRNGWWRVETGGVPALGAALLWPPRAQHLAPQPRKPAGSAHVGE